MSRDSYLVIRNDITWTDTADVTEDERRQQNRADGFWMISTLFSALKESCQKYYTPNRHISIDEVCIFFKGRHRCRCYNPNKPNNWNFKVFALCVTL